MRRSFPFRLLALFLVLLPAGAWAIIDLDGDGLDDVWEALFAAETLLPDETKMAMVEAIAKSAWPVPILLWLLRYTHWKRNVSMLALN